MLRARFIQPGRNKHLGDMVTSEDASKANRATFRQDLNEQVVASC